MCIHTYTHAPREHTNTHHNIDTCENKMQTKSHTNILLKRKLEDEEVSSDWYDMNHVGVMSLWRCLIVIRKTLMSYDLHEVDSISVEGWRRDERSCSSRWAQEMWWWLPVESGQWDDEECETVFDDGWKRYRIRSNVHDCSSSIGRSWGVGFSHIWLKEWKVLKRGSR